MKTIVQSIIVLFLSFVTYACAPQADLNMDKIQKDAATLSKTDDIHNHKIWDELTKKYVNEKGFANYKGFIKDSTKLNEYLSVLSANHPSEEWTSDQRKAYWINAYNAFTVKLIVDNYPVESIKDLGGSIYKVNTPWDIKFIKIEDKEYDLNNIEHSILRKEWEDPRIHAAVNCASVSCPALRKGAFTANRLDQQLDEQMKAFVNDTSKNKLSADKVRISKLFKWFTGDFKIVSPSVIAYLNEFSNVNIDNNAEIEYIEYDWGLNDAQ